MNRNPWKLWDHLESRVLIPAILIGCLIHGIRTYLLIYGG